jgi:hypothetical protein
LVASIIDEGILVISHLCLTLDTGFFLFVQAPEFFNHINDFHLLYNTIEFHRFRGKLKTDVFLVGEDGTSCLKPFFLRFVIWGNKGDGNCHGYYVRNVCVLGVEDLYRAYNGMDLFVNKFHLGYEHLALDCLEEVLYELTWKEFVDDIHIDASYYKHLHYVKMQLKSNEIYS